MLTTTRARAAAILLAAATLWHAGASRAQAVLVPGSIGLVHFDTDVNRFAFVTLHEVAAGEQLRFTDASWQGFSPGAFRTSEHSGGPLTWTNSTGGAISAGTVIRYAGSFSLGSASGTRPEISVGGDQLFIFQGSWTSPQFVFGAQFATSGSNQGIVNFPTSANDPNDTNIPGALTLGTTFQNLENVPGGNSSDNGVYTGPTTFATAAAALAALTNTSNWTYSNSSLPSALIPVSFTIAPEPSSLLLLAAAGGCAVVHRRRRQRTVQSAAPGVTRP
jgi:hypothetical protein